MITKLMFDLDSILNKIQILNEESPHDHLRREFIPFEIYKYVTDFYNVVALVELKLDEMKESRINFIDRIIFKHELNKKIRKVERVILEGKKYKGLFNPLELCCRVF